MTIRVVIADDEDLVRVGLRLVLDAQPGIEVAGEASNGVEALREVRRLRPDVVLLDVHMPALDGIATAQRILSDPSSSTRVIMLTTFDRDRYVYDAMKAGAAGFLLKSSSPESLTDAVRAATRGDTLLSPTITRRLIEEFVRRPPPEAENPPSAEGLTERETEVLRLVAQGMSNREIGQRLFLAEGTVKTHVNRILRKLQLRDRVQVVVFGYETGLVRPGHGPDSASN